MLHRSKEGRSGPCTSQQDSHGTAFYNEDSDAMDEGTIREVISSEEAAPPYEEVENGLRVNQAHNRSEAVVTDDGRVEIKINAGQRLSNFFRSSLIDTHADGPSSSVAPSKPRSTSKSPAMNIVIQLVGSRGDIQPFIAIALLLQEHGHRVRIATHSAFQTFVESYDLEFFSIGGDPMELMAFIVKNPGLLPKFETVMKGDVQKRRKTIREILEGCWRSCIESGNGMQHNPERWGDSEPFVADAIIANPPSFAHIHCAERLGVPLHLMFTMPWSPTQAFAHPLANIAASNVDRGLTNRTSFALIETIIWQGVGDIINSFRHKTLGLERIDSTWAPEMVNRLKIPHTYCWSPNLIPNPKDWGQHITVAGFSRLKAGSECSPPPSLKAFLHNGPQPIYVGFGSIVVSNPQELTNTVLEAIRLAGVRAILSQGWSELMAFPVPAHIYLLDDCPHDFLFEQVSCVVHHGGAGTTAAGISAGKPTVMVPFFGDQHWWARVVADAGAGPEPVPYRELSAKKLADAIESALSPHMAENAMTLSMKIRDEDGRADAVDSFHQHLPSAGLMSCSLDPKRVAVWRHRRTGHALSAFAATVLLKNGLIEKKQLELHRPVEYDLHHGPWEPISASFLAVSSLFYNVFKGFGEIGTDVARIPALIDSHAKPHSHSTSPKSPSSSPSSPSTTKPQTHLYTSHPPSPASPLLSTPLGLSTLKGTSRITKSIIRSPMALTFALARGAHNAPRLWGDPTVRPVNKITGLGSGCMEAGRELVLGTYDGVAGLFVQPFIGMRDSNSRGSMGGLGVVVGGVKGAARGVVSAPVKMFAAMAASVGYTLKGLDVSLSHAAHRHSSLNDPVVRARLEQGEVEYAEVQREDGLGGGGGGGGRGGGELERVLEMWEALIGENGG